jgi:hypothetical protein
VSRLRDFLVTPRGGEEAIDDRAPAAGEVAVAEPALPTGEEVVGDRARRRRRPHAAVSSAPAPAIAVLAPARDVLAAACGAGLAVGRSAPAVLVCVSAPVLAPGLRAPPRGAAARLTASLRARGLDASARGRLALVHLPDERGMDAVTRALAAADGLPTVLAVAGRDDEVDALLASRDAILVALPPSAEPAMVQLALAGAAALAPVAAAVTLALDPVQRGLAIAGARAPRAISAAVRDW